MSEQCEDGFDSSGTREDLVAWRKWAFGKVGPHRRCSDLMDALDVRTAQLAATVVAWETWAAAHEPHDESCACPGCVQ